MYILFNFKIYNIMKVLFYLKSLKVTILSSLLLLLFAVSSYSQSGWFSQPLPVNGEVQDLKFFDANTGLIAMWQPNLILKTTNGGYNWDIVYSTGRPAFELCMIDSFAVYVNSSTTSEYGMLLRSYDRGATWDSLPIANSWSANGLSFVNRDTGWVSGTAGGEPFLWKTTNGGLTWTVNSSVTGRGKVFFLKYKVNGEYIGWSQDPPNMYKTTNSGNSWFQIMNIAAASQIYFIDEKTGWAATGDNVRKTTNGGLNWTQHFLPTGFNISMRTLQNFKHLNKDTIYGDRAYRNFGTVDRGIIWMSTNGGVNWNFQQPDTSIRRLKFYGIDFANKDTGFSDWIRTNDGGGPLIITGINNQLTTKPEIFILEQNYPNPFNSSTRINFSVSRPSYITFTVYDISGKEVLKIYNNEFFTAGNYFAGIDIGRMGLSSGVYIYRMTAADLQSNNIYTESKKLVYLK